MTNVKKTLQGLDRIRKKARLPGLYGKQFLMNATPEQ